MEPTCISCLIIRAQTTKSRMKYAETQTQSTFAKMSICSAYEKLQHASCWGNTTNSKFLQINTSKLTALQLVQLKSSLTPL